MPEAVAGPRRIALTEGYLPVELARDTVESLYAEHGPQRPWSYWLILGGVIAAFVSLPLLKVDVSVRAPGVVRPATERSDLRAPVGGFIAQVLVRDNEKVSAGQPLLTLQSRDLEERIARNLSLQRQHSEAIGDLQKMTGNTARIGSGDIDGLNTLRAEVAQTLVIPMLQQDYIQFLAQLDASRLKSAKARSEHERTATLAAKGISTRRELDDARYAADQALSEVSLLIQQALARWQSSLRAEQIALEDLVTEQRRLDEERRHYTIRAPEAGVAMGFTGLGAGSFVQPGQVLGSLSPDDQLVAEVLVASRDIGLVRVGQLVRMQIEAYPYTQWGTLDGQVERISDDYLSGGQAPVFKATVRPRTTALRLSNGVRGELKKGLTLNARFLVSRRSVFQLLYDDVSSWLNPQESHPTI